MVAIIVLKVFGLGIAALFAMLAIVFDYREADSGKLTLFGRLSVICILAGLICSATMAVLEIAHQVENAAATADRALEQALRDREILEELVRVVHRVEDVEVSAVFSIPLSGSVFDEYRSDARDVIEPALNAYRESGGSMSLEEWSSHGISGWSASDGVITRLTIDFESSIHPYNRRGEFMQIVSGTGSLGIDAYVDHIAPEDFVPPLTGAPRFRPDFSFRVATEFDDFGRSGSYELSPECDRLIVTMRMVEVDGSRKASGRIVSRGELLRSQVFVTVRDGSRFEGQTDLTDVMRSAEIQYITFEVNGNRTTAYSDRITHYNSKRGFRFCQVRIPSERPEAGR